MLYCKLDAILKLLETDNMILKMVQTEIVSPILGVLQTTARTQ